MRVCENGPEVKVTRYSDLSCNDIFKWGKITDSHRQESVCVKVLSGHIYLTGTGGGGVCRAGNGFTTMNDVVIIYPDACIQLGDPK